MRSLVSDVTINPLVCKNEIWLTRASTTAKLCAQSITPSPEDSAGSNQDLFDRDGYFVVPRLFPQWCNSGIGSGYNSIEGLAVIMDRLDFAGWPPVFCFMCDAVWDLIATLMG